MSIKTTADQVNKLYGEIDGSIRENLKNSIVTDIVECESKEIQRFATYWDNERYDLADLDNPMILQYIPGDIFRQNTIPIIDMKIISQDDHTTYPPIPEGKTLHYTMRVCIFPEVIRNLPTIIDRVTHLRNDNLTREKNSVVIGAVEFCLVPGPIITTPLVYVCTTNEVFASAIPAKHISPEPIPFKSDNMVSRMSKLRSFFLGAWYGMQLALLHPATKDVFANPIREKRSHKEQLIPVTTSNTNKPKRVKYVKKHIINAENGIDATLQKALDELNSDRQEGEKIQYIRKALLWRVIGHDRHYPSGKTVWIEPYWKGILRDFHQKQYASNVRDIDVPLSENC